MKIVHTVAITAMQRCAVKIRLNLAKAGSNAFTVGCPQENKFMESSKNLQKVQRIEK